MLPVENWLTGRNLPMSPKRAHLEGEALTYALVTYGTRPTDLPEEVLTFLAESFFSRLGPQPQVEVPQ